MTTEKKIFAIILASCATLFFLLVGSTFVKLAIWEKKMEKQAQERALEREMELKEIVQQREKQAQERKKQLLDCLKSSPCCGSGRCYNLIILDESGSMQGLIEETLTGANETIAAIKVAADSIPDLKQYLSVVTFTTRVDEDTVKILSSMIPVPKMRYLDTEDYHPSGNTPLYDAVGEMLMRLAPIIPEDAAALVTIITDGEENASRRYTSYDIQGMIGVLEERGWTFAYIGANQDAILEAGKIGVSNALNYDANKDGVLNMMNDERYSRIQFYRRLRSALSRKDRHDAGVNYFQAH